MIRWWFVGDCLVICSVILCDFWVIVFMIFQGFVGDVFLVVRRMLYDFDGFSVISWCSVHVFLWFAHDFSNVLMIAWWYICDFRVMVDFLMMFLWFIADSFVICLWLLDDFSVMCWWFVGDSSVIIWWFFMWFVCDFWVIVLMIFQRFVGDMLLIVRRMFYDFDGFSVITWC